MQHQLDVICPNCQELLAVPVKIGQVHINPKSVYLVNMQASVKHSCKLPQVEVPVEEEK